MSEMPPDVSGQLNKPELYRDRSHKIIDRKIEEGEYLLKEEGGGKRVIETIVECDGHQHTRVKDEIHYNDKDLITGVTELGREVIELCDGSDHKKKEEDNDNELSAAA